MARGERKNRGLADPDGAPVTPEYHFRAAERVPVDIGAAIGLPGGDEVAVRLRDLSTMGFMAECPVHVPIGSKLWLRIAGCPPIEAEIRWALSGWIGCRFEDELDWNSFRSALEHGSGD